MQSNSVLGLLMIFTGLALASGGVLVMNRKTLETTHRPAESLTSEERPAESLTPEKRPAESLTSEDKGRKFEEWVVRKFNPSYFTIKDWRGDKGTAGIYAESSQFPDLEIEFGLRDRRVIFSVECKWRWSFVGVDNPGIEWASVEQIDHYRRFQRQRGIPVFVVIGIGGEPDNPSELYIANLERLKYPYASVQYLAKFRRTKLGGDFYFDPEKPELR